MRTPAPLLVAVLALSLGGCGIVDAEASGSPVIAAVPEALPEVELGAVSTPKRTAAVPEAAKPLIAEIGIPAAIPKRETPKQVIGVFWDDCPACGMG